VSEFCDEIEESCLLGCHFYLPEKKTSIYVQLVLPDVALAPGTCPAEPLRTSEYNMSDSYQAVYFVKRVC